MKQLISFTKKEFYHIFRDVRTVMILLLMPVLQLIIFGYAITNEVKNSSLAILDFSKDEITRKITGHIQENAYFDIVALPNDRTEIDALFRKGKIKSALIFPAEFGSGLTGTGTATVQFITDASDPNEASTISNYMQMILVSSQQEIPGISGTGITAGVQLLYNPQMKGAFNFVPGVMGLILMLICAMMTSVAIVRESESGTMEVLLVSPLRAWNIVIAKAIPYFMISMANVLTIMVLSVFLLGVPIMGSIGSLLLLSVLFILVSLSLGLLISTLVDNQQAAMMISAVALMLPVILLSGMIFPVENMPWILQMLSNIVPAKWYIIGVKNIMIKGLGISSIFTQLAVLSGMVVFLLSISVLRFKNRLE